MLRQVFIVCTLQVAIFASSLVKISTPSGDILGASVLVSRLGKPIISFRGIRFAEAPVGKLRFKPPVPTKNWTGVYNAIFDGAICPQPVPDTLKILRATSEDCLFLNVYTTKLPEGRNNPKRPVMVYFFGGGFSVGTGHSAFYGPQYLMDHDIVLVTFNFRQAALGFLSLNKEVPGNNGLRDQVVVLQWVRDNIEAYGGDPNSVTLVGSSSGACSINLHMVSSMSRGLFHKAILSSCAVTAGMPLTPQEDLAGKQARFVGCPDSSSQEILDCLRTKPAQEIADTLPQFNEFGNNPIDIWLPVIEKDYGQERFLKEDPVKSIVDGKFVKVPVLAGVTRDEFAVQAPDIIQNQTLLNELNNDFEKWAPVIFIYERNTAKSHNISRQIKQFYFDNKPITPTNDSLTNLEEAFADSIIGFRVNQAVDLFAQYSHKPVYYYEFTYQQIESVQGLVGHGTEQVYLFYSPLLPVVANPEIVANMTSYWANFVKTGNPGTSVWQPYSLSTKKYLEIGEAPVLRDHLFEHRYAFWRQLYPISNYL